MKLTTIKRSDRDDNGFPYDLLFIVDLDSERAYGYVETPSIGTQQIMFAARPYTGEARWYISESAALGYLQSVAMQQEREEAESFKTAMQPKDAAQEVPAR